MTAPRDVNFTSLLLIQIRVYIHTHALLLEKNIFTEADHQKT